MDNQELALHKNSGNFEHLVKKHPCFNLDGNFKHGRLHLPVSPTCNIQCKFCCRSFNKDENRPGVTGSIVTPEEALKVVEKALELCPEITVIGIAGPGDTLASPYALDTFALVHAKYPELIKCLSTNGLELNDKAEQIVKAGVTTVTVTVNAIDPEVQSKICSRVVFDCQVLKGIPAAEQLVKNQLWGIKKITELGLIVKINTVLIPGVNDGQVSEVARLTAEAGASLINIIPLIPQNEFAQHRAPDCNELNKAREDAGKYLPVFRHCQHCRADACGIPSKGKDLADQLYGHTQETFSHG